jgi:hypothetical protein
MKIKVIALGNLLFSLQIAFGTENFNRTYFSSKEALQADGITVENTFPSNCPNGFSKLDKSGTFRYGRNFEPLIRELACLRKASLGIEYLYIRSVGGELITNLEIRFADQTTCTTERLEKAIGPGFSAKLDKRRLESGYIEQPDGTQVQTLCPVQFEEVYPLQMKNQLYMFVDGGLESLEYNFRNPWALVNGFAQDAKNDPQSADAAKMKLAKQLKEFVESWRTKDGRFLSRKHPTTQKLANSLASRLQDIEVVWPVYERILEKSKATK